MQPLLKQYLDGTLQSSGDPKAGDVTVENRLLVPVWAGFLTPDGSVYPAIGVPAGKTVTKTVLVNWYWLVWALDGSLAAAFKGLAPPGDRLTIKIGATDLSPPQATSGRCRSRLLRSRFRTIRLRFWWEPV